MRVAGLPLWAIVLVACALAPILIRVLLDAEQRRAKKRTAEILQGLARPIRASGDPPRAAGARHAASIQGAGHTPDDGDAPLHARDSRS